ncbi:MAG: hypothetical protein ACRCT8_12860 [Lacipirellulaceae bacterium]
MDRSRRPARLPTAPAPWVAAGLLCVAIGDGAVVDAAQPVVAASATASVDRGAPPAPVRVKFAKRASAVGDTIEQAIDTSLDVKLRERRGAEVIDERATASTRRQRRRVTATSIDAGRVVAAEVRFFESHAERGALRADDPIVGKAYHCRRQGERLVVTTDEGQVPPKDEFVAVSLAMESLGKPNPLADYLAGRDVTVGERLVLPAEVAAGALGFDDRLGRVERFALTLAAIDERGGRRLARFDGEVEATGAGSSQMRVVVTGPIVVEVATCRVASAELSGPFAMIESRGSLGNTVLVDSTGRLGLKIAAEHRDARR